MSGGALSFGLAAEGYALGLEARLGLIAGSTTGVYGSVTLDKAGLARMCKSLGMPDECAKLCAGFLGDVVMVGSFVIKSGVYGVSLEGAGLSLLVRRQNGAFTVLFAIETAQLRSAGGWLASVAPVLEWLSLESIRFIFNPSGTARIEAPPGAAQKAEALAIPAGFSGCTMAVAASLDLVKWNSPFAQGLRALLGIQNLAFWAGVGGDGVSVALVTSVKSSLVEVDPLYMAISVGKAPGFTIGGTLVVLLEKPIGFTLKCTATPAQFTLSGSMVGEIEFGFGWKLSQLALVIGWSNGLTFGMAGRLTARTISLFASLVLSVKGQVPTVDMLCAAASDLTLPAIVGAFCDSVPPAVADFDLVQIVGFSLPGAGKIEPEVVKTAKKEEVVKGYNEAMPQELRVPEDAAGVTTMQSGLVLFDNSRMRNYTVYEDGRIALSPQFYFAAAALDMGDMKITPGVFLCGVVSILGFSIALVLSISPTDGILAYVQCDPIDLGFLKLTATDAKTEGNVKPLPVGSMVEQFISPDGKGAELFLCVSKTDCSFYLDAKLTVLWSLVFEARVVFAGRQVSIDTRFDFFKIFEATLQLRVDYSSFNSLAFGFLFTIDTSGLERMVKGAIEKIDAAAKKFEAGMNSARSKVQSGQNEVNKLYREIDSLDQKISDCKRSISNAKWYKKIWAGIYYGAQIAAFSIAKAAVYVAIGVATAALKIVEGLLIAAQAVGTGILKGVQGFLQGLISLFYIRKFTIGAVLSNDNKAFLLRMEFVALGKDYTFEKKIGSGDCSEAQISGLLNGGVEEQTAADVKELESGAKEMSRSKYRYREISMDSHRQTLRSGAASMRRFERLSVRTQAAYAQEFSEPMLEGDEWNAGMAAARKETQSYLELADDILARLDFDEAFDEVESSIEDQPEGTVRNARSANLGKLRAEWDSLKQLRDETRKNMQSICDECETDLFAEAAEAVEQVYTPEQHPAVTGEHPEVESMDSMMDTTEELILDCFPYTRAPDGSLNLAKEPVIFEGLDALRSEGRSRNEDIVRRRGRVNREGYTTQL